MNNNYKWIIDYIPCVVLYILVAYFIQYHLYLSIPYPLVAPPSFLSLPVTTTTSLLPISKCIGTQHIMISHSVCLSFSDSFALAQCIPSLLVMLQMAKQTNKTHIFMQLLCLGQLPAT